MSVNSVNVSGTLRMPSGLPAAKASVRFTLSGPSIIGISVVVPSSVTAVANQAGVFSIAIAPNAKYSYYTVTVFKATGGTIMDTIVVIPPYDCQFSKIIQTRALPPLNAAQAAMSDLQEAQASIETARLGVMAAADKSNKNTADAMVQLDNAVNTYKQLIKNTQSTIVGLVDTAMTSSIDLVTAYQLSK